MANVRELMARLGPPTVKFDTGRGGKPDLTNQDIAAAGHGACRAWPGAAGGLLVAGRRGPAVTQAAGRGDRSGDLRTAPAAAPTG